MYIKVHKYMIKNKIQNVIERKMMVKNNKFTNLLKNFSLPLLILNIITIY